MQRTQITREIEQGLEQYRPNEWRRLTSDELKEIHAGFQLGWQVSVPVGVLEHEKVDHLILAVDSAFPNSQPRVIAPAADNEYSWPHVEPLGLLCLRATRNTAPIVDRIVAHLKDADELLSFTESKRDKEFEREFSAYWAQRATNGPVRTRVHSLVSPGGATREVAYFFDTRFNYYIIADDKSVLSRWLRNTGVNPNNKQISTTWLFRLLRPWTPNEFPERGVEIARLVPSEAVHKCLKPGLRLPFLFEAKTETGPVFVAVILNSAKRSDVLRGFRHISRVPPARIVNSYVRRPVERCIVTRVDGAWIHGRDHASSHMLIKNRKVVIIGCGSIGATLAHLLAQAGIGELIFVDPDRLNTANISRHLLGFSNVGSNKAIALQAHLRREFPHLTFQHAFQKSFEKLSSMELVQLADADLVISAGIDFDGEAAIDHWRRGLQRIPALLSTWTEAFAAAGHAILLYGKASILIGFDEEELATFRLTDWPEGAAALIVEAGCGNTFQPHGVIDLYPTVSMAAGLAIDMLTDKIPSSCRRVWMGNPDVVNENGGIIRTTFTDRYALREFVWP